VIFEGGTHSLSLMPLGQFEGGEFRVFYEVCNLELEQTYLTEVTVEPMGRHGAAPAPVQVTEPRGFRAAQADREFVVIPRQVPGGQR
jgi:hypothetical protein